jgi:type II secretory pathway pseudopilin PulG
MRRAVLNQSGFTYLGILAAVVIIGISLATVGVVWSTHGRREKEAELLFVGEQYRAAIGRYVNAGGIYPRSLQDLVLDQRLPLTRRFLRRLYADPMTREADWELIQTDDGGIMGIASASALKPIKLAGFSLANKSFENARSYAGWRFIYVGTKARNQAPGRGRDLTPLPKFVPLQP